MYGLLDTLSRLLHCFKMNFGVLNGCISFSIGPINAKLEDFLNLGFLSLTL